MIYNAQEFYNQHRERYKPSPYINKVPVHIEVDTDFIEISSNLRKYILK